MCLGVSHSNQPLQVTASSVVRTVGSHACLQGTRLLSTIRLNVCQGTIGNMQHQHNSLLVMAMHLCLTQSVPCACPSVQQMIGCQFDMGQASG